MWCVQTGTSCTRSHSNDVPLAFTCITPGAGLRTSLLHTSGRAHGGQRRQPEARGNARSRGSQQASVASATHWALIRTWRRRTPQGWTRVTALKRTDGMPEKVYGHLGHDTMLKWGHKGRPAHGRSSRTSVQICVSCCTAVARCIGRARFGRCCG